MSLFSVTSQWPYRFKCVNKSKLSQFLWLSNTVIQPNCAPVSVVHVLSLMNEFGESHSAQISFCPGATHANCLSASLVSISYRIMYILAVINYNKSNKAYVFVPSVCCCSTCGTECSEASNIRTTGPERECAFASSPPWICESAASLPFHFYCMCW